MQKQEFEERIERTVTDEQYKVIEEVYMWHPSIRNTSGKDEVAELYKSFGMTIFHDMLPRAKKAHELDELLRNAQREVQRIQEEIEELSCPTLRVEGVVKGENEESGDTVQQTGANITSALTSKAASVRKEKESKTTTTKETYTSERWGKEGGTTIHQISFTVDISKIKDLPLLYKLIDELKDAQNRTDSPTPATT